MIIGEICYDEKFNKRYSIQKNLYSFLSNKYKKFYFINIFYILNKKKLKKEKSIYNKKNIIFFNPQTLSELNKFLKKDKIFLINNLSFKFSRIFFHYLVSKKNIFQISFSTIPIPSNFKEENWESVNFIQKIKFIFNKRISLIFYRILIILRIINQINIFYVSQKKVYEKYNDHYNKKEIFLKKYKNVSKTNIKDPFEKNFKNKSDKYITFIDSNILHPDYQKRGQKLNNNMIKSYFSFLKNYLIKLKKIFKKEVIICLHPSSNTKLYRKELNGFKMYKHQTEKFILKSHILLFHETSSILSGILLKKKIINLKSQLMGFNSNKRAEFYKKKFKFVCHDIEKNLIINKKKLKSELVNNVNKYHKYFDQLYFYKDKSLSIENLLSKEIKKFKNLP